MPSSRRCGEAMDVDTWDPIYQAIVAAFGYDVAADRRARDRAESYLQPYGLDRLDLAGDAVAIVVGADLDAAAVRSVRRFDHVVATADALDRLARAAVPVRLAVTDLDSDPARVCARTRRGRSVAIHAHGDNVAAIDRWLPRTWTRAVLGTTQVRPTDVMVNVGGFTDGDRAAFLADALGAASIDLVGWAFDDPTVSPEKRRKLAWAARLLTWLERHRDERYDALDGHRDDRLC